MYLQYYMTHVIKTHIACIFFSLTAQKNPLLLLSLSAILRMFWFLSLRKLFPKNTSIVGVFLQDFFFYFLCVSFSFCCVLCAFAVFFFVAGVFLCCIVFDLLGPP